ncbi:hypothetical protein C8R43DRAFT_233099 [Mycena crocata]|nr:hypothetical protein C8R43DRAFT_233099 [Mycena crocata]
MYNDKHPYFNNPNFSGDYMREWHPRRTISYVTPNACKEARPLHDAQFGDCSLARFVPLTSVLGLVQDICSIYSFLSWSCPQSCRSSPPSGTFDANAALMKFQNLSMSTLTWRSRFFFLLLIPCILGLFFFFSFPTHVDTTGVALTQSFAVADGTGVANNEASFANILLVTAFYPLSKSKHTMREYESWLSQLLQPVTTDIYFYCPVEMEALVRQCRGDLPITVDTTYSSPFDIPPLNASREHYFKMHSQDRERARHSPELYAVWNAKPFFLDEAVQTLSRTGKQYDYAFWNDAGSLRSTHKYTGWPDSTRVQQVWEEGSALAGEKVEDLLFFPIDGIPHPSMKYWVQDHGPIDTAFSEGSFFGGSPSTIAWWRRTFYAYHDHYLRLDLFVGKDQTLINAILLLFPSRVIAVWLDDPEAPAHTGVDEGALGNCGAEWFYYQFWLARPDQRQAMHRIWEGSTRWSWNWWRQRQPCKITRVSSLKTLLQRQFGSDWQPPVHTINV